MSDPTGPPATSFAGSNDQLFRDLIEQHPDGIVVVDVTGKVLYRNSAAAHMLSGLGLDSFFGFPTSAGDVTELDLITTDGGALVVEMRSMETTWAGAPAYLATLRDVTDTRDADDSLNEERQRLDRVVMGSADAIVFVSPDGEVMEWNPAAQRMFGWSKQQVLGHRMDELILIEPEGSERLGRGERGEVIKKVAQRKRRDGSMFKAEITSSAVYDSFGSISGYVSVIRDVTEQVLIEAATTAMASELDPTQAVTSFADVLADVFPFCQLSLTVVQGDHYRRVVSVSGADDVHLPGGELVPLEGNSTGHAVETRLPLVNQDTSEGQWPFDATLLEAGVRSYVVIPLIQENRVFATFNLGFPTVGAPTAKMVTTLRALGTAVSAGVKNILAYEAERETRQRLEELDSLKNEFLAMVSHDLRNPLAVIGGFADTMTLMWSKLGDEQKLHMVDAIKRNANSLAKRVEQDLDVALIESGRFSFKTRAFDLARTVQSTVEDVRRSFPDRDLLVEMESALPQAIADEERTAQVLTNLLSNAVKYSPEGSPVSVAVERMARGLQVSVTDRGEGIPESQIPHLFKKLSRLEGSRDRVKGTGLGLYISKALVDGMGGEIWCSSVPGTGSTFGFWIPSLGAIARPDQP